MTPEINIKDEFIVVGLRSVLEIGGLSAATLWKDRFLPRQSEVKSAERRYFGVFNHLPGNEHDGRYEYVVGVVTNSLEDIPVGMVGWVIPEGKYAEVEAVGLAGIGQKCRDLIADWLPDSGYQLVASPMFAYTDSAHPDAGDAQWKVNIPVETPEVLAQLETWLCASEM